jgi:intein/homing endonuclease
MLKNVEEIHPMSCAAGTLVRTTLGDSLLIEKLFEGAELVGLREQDEDPVRVIQPLQFAMRPCVRIKTEEGNELVCEGEHALLLSGRGLIGAAESLNQSVRTRGGSVRIVDVNEVGERRVVRLRLDPPHVFESNDLLSEE